MGFYIQDDFWLAVEDAPRSAQDALFGSLVRLFFLGEDEPPKGAAKGVYIALRDRERKAKVKSHPGAAGRKPGNQNDNQNGNQTEIKPESNTQSKPESNGNQTEITSIKEGEGEIEGGEEPRVPPCGETLGARRFVPPTPQQVREYAESRGDAIDAERFCDHYASKGWRIGRSPMKDWKAAARNWVARDKDFRRTAGKGAMDDETAFYAGLGL